MQIAAFATTMSGFPSSSSVFSNAAASCLASVASTGERAHSDGFGPDFFGDFVKLRLRAREDGDVSSSVCKGEGDGLSDATSLPKSFLAANSENEIIKHTDLLQ